MLQEMVMQGPEARERPLPHTAWLKLFFSFGTKWIGAEKAIRKTITNQY